MRKKVFRGRGISLLLLLALVLGLLPAYSVFAATEQVDVRISYKLDGVTSVGKGSPFGAVFYFDFLGNSPSAGSEDAKVTVSASGIALSKKTFDLISPTELPEEFQLETSSTDVLAAYIPEQYMTNTGRSVATLKFTITWTNGSGSSSITYRATGQKTITECVLDEGASSSEPEETSSLMLEGYTVSKQNLREGDKFDLTVTVRNNGQKTCNNVNVKMPSLDKITVNGRLSEQVIPSLDPGATAAVTFPMLCASSMTTGNVGIGLSLSSDEVQAKDSTAYIYVTGTAEDETTSQPEDAGVKPVIILESYDYGGEAVQGGKEFELTMNFKNTSRTQSIENAVIKVSAVTNDTGAGGAFTPANSSSTFYVESLGPGQTIQEKITLLPKADAEPNSYSMQVSFDYVYGKTHQAANDSVTFSIPITQEDRFTISSADLYGPIYMGDSGYLSINYVNKGKSTVYNLSVELQGNFTSVDGTTMYIGNVNSGTGDSYDATLTPNEPGMLEGTAVFTYEDASGNQKTVEQPFSCEVIENTYVDPGFDPGMDPGMIPEEEQGFPVWGIVLIAAAGAGLAAVIVVVVLKKRRAKRRRLLEEMDDEDDFDPSQFALPYSGNAPAAQQPEAEAPAAGEGEQRP